MKCWRGPLKTDSILFFRLSSNRRMETTLPPKSKCYCMIDDEENECKNAKSIGRSIRPLNLVMTRDPDTRNCRKQTSNEKSKIYCQFGQRSKQDWLHVSSLSSKQWQPPLFEVSSPRSDINSAKEKMNRARLKLSSLGTSLLAIAKQLDVVMVSVALLIGYTYKGEHMQGTAQSTLQQVVIIIVVTPKRLRTVDRPQCRGIAHGSWWVQCTFWQENDGLRKTVLIFSTHPQLASCGHTSTTSLTSQGLLQSLLLNIQTKLEHLSYNIELASSSTLHSLAHFETGCGESRVPVKLLHLILELLATVSLSDSILATRTPKSSNHTRDHRPQNSSE